MRNLEEFKADFEDQYEYASEEIDLAFPEPKGKPIATSIIIFDSDHAYDTENRRSISGVLVVAGSTPVSWMSKCQRAVATSTYSAEFCAMRSFSLFSIENALTTTIFSKCLQSKKVFHCQKWLCSRT